MITSAMRSASEDRLAIVVVHQHPVSSPAWHQADQMTDFLIRSCWRCVGARFQVGAMFGTAFRVWKMARMASGGIWLAKRPHI